MKGFKLETNMANLVKSFDNLAIIGERGIMESL